MLHLFVSKHQQDRIPQLVLSQHPHQLLSRLIHTLSVVTVHHKDQTCRNEENTVTLMSKKM